MSATVAQKLAAFASDLTYTDLPTAVIEKIRSHTLDSLGCQLLGAIQPWNQVVLEYAVAESPPGPATFVGIQEGGRPEWVALANGTCAQGFEADDYHQAGQIHPGAVAVPTAFAVAQEVNASDEQIVTALALGFEVSLRIAIAATPGITYGRGIHTQSAVGPFGAAVAAGKLRGLGEREMAYALGIAGSHSGGTLEYTQTGGEVKRLHAGIADMAGIRAATLASHGLTAPLSIFEGRRGFYQAYSDRVDLDVVCADLGHRWESLGAALKPYCANGLIQAPLRAIYEMIADDGLTADDVRSITVGTNRFALYAVASVGPHPRQMQEAQFSLHFSLALALTRGGNDYEDYAAAEQTGFMDTKMRGLAEKVSAELDAEADAAYPLRFCSRVTVVTKSGRRLVRYVGSPGSPEEPLSYSEVTEKFRRAARHSLDATQRGKLEAAIGAMPDGASLLGAMPLLGRAQTRANA